MRDHLDPVSPSRAFELAAGWGSYQNDRDPGRVFYTFKRDMLPEDEAHRRWMLDEIEKRIHRANVDAAKHAAAEGLASARFRNDEHDARDLHQLHHYFRQLKGSV
jgi:hypothetical protein